jgi:hypothetical protein
MAERGKPGRKLLIASIGVAAVSYVACGGKNIGQQSAGGSNLDGGTNTGTTVTTGNPVVANLVAPPDPCADFPSQGSPSPQIAQSQPLELTNDEYDHTVRDLLGDVSQPSRDFPADDTQTGFRRDVAGIDPGRVGHYAMAAAAVADGAVGRLASILPCDPGTTGEPACVTQFITDFGRRAFRRPLSTDEQSQLHQAYDAARTDGDFAAGIRAVIFAALISPHFYQIEEKGDSQVATLLGPYAMASRLSYFIYRSMPDDELFATAGASKLSTPDQIELQVRRMLQDPKAHDGVIEFFREWLQLDNLRSIEKSDAVYPNFDSVRDAMITETTKFGESIFFGTGSLDSLLTDSSTWANADLAAIYGAPLMGTGFQRLQLDNKVRAGILTQPSILSLTSGPDETSPTRRGALVRRALLCGTIPPHPNSVPPVLPPVMPGVSTRDRYRSATQSAACASCHVAMDPIGFGFEQFDPVGRFRTTDNGQLIDPSGQLRTDDGTSRNFIGVVELAKLLSMSDQARACIATQWFRFAMARTETDEDGCGIALVTRIGQDGRSMQEIVIAIATSNAFRYARW